MASSTLPIIAGHGLLHKSTFLGQTTTHLLRASPTQISNTPPPTSSSTTLKVTAKFKLSEILGGRGLCNGEAGLQEELNKTITTQESSPSSSSTTTDKDEPSAESTIVPEDGFGKELLGLTGGFPGGEKGLRKFIEQNPPPKKPPPKGKEPVDELKLSLARKPKAPELPLLMPGMIAIVKNKNSPYYMLCGIVQRITDGRAGVLFEGGNWDRLITFRLEELERREKGPPMVSPRSVVLEEAVAENNKTAS